MTDAPGSPQGESSPEVRALLAEVAALREERDRLDVLYDDAAGEISSARHVIDDLTMERDADLREAIREALERVVRAGVQLAARVPLPDVDGAAAIMEWRAAVAAIRALPLPSPHES